LLPLHSPFLSTPTACFTQVPRRALLAGAALVVVAALDDRGRAACVVPLAVHAAAGPRRAPVRAALDQVFIDLAVAVVVLAVAHLGAGAAGWDAGVVAPEEPLTAGVRRAGLVQTREVARAIAVAAASPGGDAAGPAGARAGAAQVGTLVHGGIALTQLTTLGRAVAAGAAPGGALGAALHAGSRAGEVALRAITAWLSAGRSRARVARAPAGPGIGVAHALPVAQVLVRLAGGAPVGDRVAVVRRVRRSVPREVDPDLGAVIAAVEATIPAATADLGRVAGGVVPGVRARRPPPWAACTRRAPRKSMPATGVDASSWGSKVVS
jgi:hypothetical protein